MKSNFLNPNYMQKVKYLLYATETQAVKDDFINPTDSHFLQHYSVENLMEMVMREHLNQYRLHVTELKDRKTRAETIDMLFYAAQ